jgi:hypothetical protein
MSINGRPASDIIMHQDLATRTTTFSWFCRCGKHHLVRISDEYLAKAAVPVVVNVAGGCPTQTLWYPPSKEPGWVIEPFPEVA